jgi:hypothetical protein
MKKAVLLIILTATLFSCMQGIKSATENTEPETINSIRKYVYADATGNRVIFENSVPKGGGYIGSDGKRYPYVVFYTQVTNQTINPVHLQIRFPSDSLEFPLSSGNNVELFVPSDTMTNDKVSLIGYGLPIEKYFEKGAHKSHSFERTILPKDSTAFYVVMLSDKGINGTIRTGLSLKGHNLVYKISAYKSIPGLPLMEEKEINCGSMDVKNFVLLK